MGLGVSKKKGGGMQVMKVAGEEEGLSKLKI
jgi:hypothetical protein